MSSYSIFREIWKEEDSLPEEPWWVVLGCDRDCSRKEARQAFYRMTSLGDGESWGTRRTRIKRIYMAWDAFIRERSTVKEHKKKPDRDPKLNEKRLIF